MARQIHTRWKITGTLKAETPIHVGGMGGNADTDLALAVNGKGNYYIPGTSLAGALRGWMEQILDEDALKDIWGDHEHEKRGASLIIIEDAEIQDDPLIEIREGVGIDRYTGAAADGQKYNRAILPKGVTFPLKITLDCKQDSEETELWKLLFALENGDIRIGAAKTRGLGKVKLVQIKIKKHQLNSVDGLFNSLLNQNLKEEWTDLKQTIIDKYQPPAKLDLKIDWKPKDPVMVKAEGDGIAVDILPLVSQVDSDVRFVIPGSSIKGVLRAHAERIVRTVCPKTIKDEADFLEQVKLDLVNELFGKAETKKPILKGEKQKSWGKIGVLGVDDCYAKISMTSDNWQNVENAAKSSNDEFGQFKQTLATALNLQNSDREKAFTELQPAMHVAIDRWTGGAAEGMLYSVLEPIGVEWEEIGIHLDLERLKKYGETNVQPAIALLLLVLRDFANRKIPIGYGTNRGMGTVEVTAMQSTASNVKDLAQLNGVHSIDNDLLNLDAKLLEKLTKSWQDWIKLSTQANQEEEQAA